MADTTYPLKDNLGTNYPVRLADNGDGTYSFGGAGGGGGGGCVASANFTPAAALYGALDIMDVAKEFTFRYANGVAVPVGSIIRVLTTILKIDQTGLQASEGAYTLSLYRVTPPSAQADNAAWTLASADLPSYSGDLPLGTPVDRGAACSVKTQQFDLQDIRCGDAASSLFGRLVTVPSFTPTAVARQVCIFGVVL